MPGCGCVPVASGLYALALKCCVVSSQPVMPSRRRPFAQTAKPQDQGCAVGTSQVTLKEACAEFDGSLYSATSLTHSILPQALSALDLTRVPCIMHTCMHARQSLEPNEVHKKVLQDTTCCRHSIPKRTLPQRCVGTERAENSHGPGIQECKKFTSASCYASGFACPKPTAEASGGNSSMGERGTPTKARESQECSAI